MASIEVTCVECGAVNRVNRNMAGRRVRCPGCDTAVHVPEFDPDLLPDDDDDDDDDEFTMELEDGDGVVIDEPIEQHQSELDQGEFSTQGPRSETSIEQQMLSAAEEEDDDERDDDEQDDDEQDDDQYDQVLPRKQRGELDLDMTPMVDVTFLLLIFFMVTAAFSLQKSIEMPRQQTDAPSTTVVEEEKDDLDMVEVQIDEFGSFLVMAPDWERETPGKQNLITALKEAIEANAGAMRLVVMVHELAKLEALVDVMDAGVDAGYAELQVTQVEDFD